MREVVIVSAKRTGIGSFGGSLSGLSAVEIGIICAKDVIESVGINTNEIDEVLVGNVLSAGLGQNIARQISIGAGLPEKTPAMTLNIVCGSGLRSVATATQIIKCGDADIILCGGTESMSNAPYLLNNNRFGKKMGNDQIVDSMINDALWDAFNDYHMGVTAENIAKQFNISREEQDIFAANSQQKAYKANQLKKFENEITPISILQKKGESIIFDNDEYIKENVTVESLSKLKSAFDKNGTVTAGNSSGINDGAAFFLLCEKEKAIELGLEIMCTIKSYATVGVSPTIMGMGVVPATQKALDLANLKVDDLDLIEVNEAFAVQALAVIRELNIPSEKINVNGGAIALGHPVGASGARVLVTLLYEMIKQDKKLGLATLCIGGGMGTSLIIER